jgi:alpha-L-fucosidase
MSTEKHIELSRQIKEVCEMKKTIIAITIFLVLCAPAVFAGQKYGPDWKSIDSRPIPAWYDDAKFGIFIHWGVYAVPSRGEWYWYTLKHEPAALAYHNRIFGEKFKYADFAPMFKAEMFDPNVWADLFAKSGARYVVLTSKHHDGYAMYPTKYSWNWNSVDTGPHRDLLGDLTKAVRAKGLKMGYYYSLYEWYNPLYMENTEEYVETHMLPQIKELVEAYKPAILWTDGEWEKTSDVWHSRELLTWLYNESSVKDDIIVNDRWGSDTRGKHGGFYTSENADVGQTADKTAALRRKWEECHTFSGAWGYNRVETLADYMSSEQVVHMLIEVVSRGGNLLMNVGPMADGIIPIPQQERLLDAGDWLRVNGDAIYGTRPWRVAEDGPKIRPTSFAHGNTDVLQKYTKAAWRKSVRYTSKGDTVYAISLVWPGKELVLTEPIASPDATVSMLGVPGDLKWRVEEGHLIIETPALSVDQAPCHYAYVFKLTGVK